MITAACRQQSGAHNITHRHAKHNEIVERLLEHMIQKKVESITHVYIPRAGHFIC